MTKEKEKARKYSFHAFLTETEKTQLDSFIAKARQLPNARLRSGDILAGILLTAAKEDVPDFFQKVRKRLTTTTTME